MIRITEERKESLRCPKCGKDMSPQQIAAIARSVVGVVVLGGKSIDLLEPRDIYCNVCYAETIKLSEDQIDWAEGEPKDVEIPISITITKWLEDH